MAVGVDLGGLGPSGPSGLGFFLGGLPDCPEGKRPQHTHKNPLEHEPQEEDLKGTDGISPMSFFMSYN